MTKDLPPIIAWDNSWSIGVEEIDEHHQKLVSMIQLLFGALITAQGADYIKGIVNDLIDYTKYHFHREEEIFEEYGYDRIEEHKQLHHELVERVLEICKLIIEKGGTEDLGDDVYRFLKTWLADHILEEDMRFKEFLDQRDTPKDTHAASSGECHS
ncbi:MAG: hemerythrin family protein [Fidelibacterota bacterium]|nr:MAG: hemerythrin family protein [Candidatus Neomarinimicrobiota bacterium]